MTRLDSEMENEWYVTTYCNRAHRLKDGKPIDHECYVLPPLALEAERHGRFQEALDIYAAAKPLRRSRGVKL